MKNFNNTIIIGIDHGYGNIKTATCCFKTGVTAYDKEPTFKENLLIWQDQYYLIGEDHKEFSADKMHDMDYYVLTLAAIARELNTRKVTSARVHIAAGLPLTWVSEQKEEFKKYLLQNNTADFTFRGANYHIEFANADVFPQGFAAVADKLGDFKGINMLCDIGNGTMNVMYINDRKPIARKCFTEKFGTNQCLLAVKENMMRVHHAAVDDSIITRALRFGKAEIAEEYLKTITDTATEYVSGIFRRLREHEYDPKLMRLYVVGGGSCLVRNFGEFDKNRVMINDDICATAKGYEYLAELNLRRNGGVV
jgi:plasmid segregation protein ParM